MYTKRALAAFLTLIQCAIPVSAATALPHTVKLRYATLPDVHSAHALATISYDPSKYTTEVQSWTPPKAPAAPAESESNLPLVQVITESGSSTLTSIGIFNDTLLSEEGRNILIKLALDSTGNVYNAYITAGIAAVDATKKPSKLTNSGKPKSKARLEREAREAARDAKAAAKAALRSAKKAGTTSTSSPQPTTSTTTSSSSAYPNIQVQLLPSLPGPAPKLAAPRQPKLAADGSQLPPGAQGEEEEQPPEKTFLQKYWWVLLIVTVLAMGGGGGQ